MILGVSLLLTGCANILAMTDPAAIKAGCIQDGRRYNQAIDECFITRMKDRDVYREKVGLPLEADKYISEVREQQENDEKAKIAYMIRKEDALRKEKESFHILERNKKRERCIIMSDAQLQDAMSNALDDGNYQLIEKLQSKEFKHKMFNYCMGIK